MIFLHLNDCTAVEISKEMFIYIVEAFKISKLKKIVYKNTSNNTVYCTIPMMKYTCITLHQTQIGKISHFNNLVPEIFYNDYIKSNL